MGPASRGRGKRPRRRSLKAFVSAATAQMGFTPHGDVFLACGGGQTLFDYPTTGTLGEIVAWPLQRRPVWVCASLGVKGATGRFQSAAHSRVVPLP